MRVIGIAMIALAGCTPGTNGEGIAGICDLPVKTVASLSITPRPVSLTPSSSVNLQALLMDSDGQIIACGPTPSWVIRDVTIAAVASSPNANAIIVRGVAVGSTYAVAAAGGRSDSVAVTVAP